MSKSIELEDGDTAVVVRHDRNSGDQYGLQVFHYFDEAVDDDTKLFYHVLARGMCAMAVNDPETLFEHASEAEISDPSDVKDGDPPQGDGETYGNA